MTRVLAVLGVVAAGSAALEAASPAGPAKVSAAALSDTADVSAAVRYDTSGASPKVIGTHLHFGQEIENDSAVVVPLPFSINFFGDTYTHACVTTDGVIMPTNAQGSCSTEYDDSAGSVAVDERRPVMAVLALDLFPGGGSLLTDGKDPGVLRGNYWPGTGYPDFQVVNGDVTLQQPSGGTLEVGDWVTFRNEPDSMRWRSFQVSAVSLSATPPTFTVSGVPNLGGIDFSLLGGHWVYGRHTILMSGQITSNPSLSGATLTLPQSANPVLVGDHVVFRATGTVLDDARSRLVTAADASTFTVSVPGVTDLDPNTSGNQTTLTGGYWRYSNGVGAPGVYAGETVIDGRQAFVVTWYRVSHNQNLNTENRSSTVQLVLIKDSSGDATTGWDFTVEYNIGSATDDEDGYSARGPSRSCEAWERNPGWGAERTTVTGPDGYSDCRWGMGFASYDALQLSSGVIANGIADLTTAAPHGLAVGTTLVIRVPFDANPPTLGDLGGYTLWGEVVDATTLRIDTRATANAALFGNLGRVAGDLSTGDLTGQNFTVRVSGEYELFSNSPISTLVDSAGSTALVRNSLNSTVLGRYRFGMRGGAMTAFARPTMGAGISMSPDALEPGAAVVLPPALPGLVNAPVGSTPASTVAPSTTVRPPTTTVPPVSSTVPAPVPGGSGALPVLAPGASQVLENGVPTSVELFVDNRTDLVLQGNGFELRLAGECTNGCTIDTTSDGRQVLTLEQQGLANVQGVGFQPGSPVYVWLFSEPRFLGELSVNADGTFSGNVALGDVEVGEHTLQVNGTSFDGKPRTANLGVVVNPAAAPSPGPGALPATGGDTGVLVWVLLLTVVGGVLVWTGRRPLRQRSGGAH